jgi:chloramphenicol 3-O-phosphotransferase
VLSFVEADESPELTAIMIVGAPAAGKSSIACRLLEILGSNATWLELDEIHRRMCPPPGDGRRYHYDAEGMLILDDRATLMVEALDELNNMIITQVRSGAVPIVLVEFSSADYGATLRMLSSLNASSVYVVAVQAPTLVTHSRNLRRPPLYRVPMTFVDMAETADLSFFDTYLPDGRCVTIDNGGEWAPSQIDEDLRQALVRWRILAGHS